MKKGNEGVNDYVTFRGQNHTKGVETKVYYCFFRKRLREYRSCPLKVRTREATLSMSPYEKSSSLHEYRVITVDSCVLQTAAVYRTNQPKNKPIWFFQSSIYSLLRRYPGNRDMIVFRHSTSRLKSMHSIISLYVRDAMDGEKSKS